MKNHKKENFATPPFTSEAVCAALLQKVSVDNISISMLGSFKKSYSNEIEKFETGEYSDTASFTVHLNRNGIYDLLPEGLFHQTLGSNRVKNVQDAVAEHKRYKQEEKNVRKFFAPVEQMLFRYRVYTEVAETEALYNIQNGKLNSSFYKFWGIDENMPKAEANRMLHLMPYCNFIKGNMDATLAALSYILRKKITVENEEYCNTGGAATPMAMSVTRLGIDTVLGTGIKEILQSLVFTIHGIEQKDLPDYVENESINKLLNRFTEIFIPLEMDVAYEVARSIAESEEEHENILGYGSYL